MKTPRSAVPWAAAAALLFFACGSLFEYESANKPPGAPFIDSIVVSTKNDTLPCVKIFFHDTNTMQVSFNMERAGPNSTKYDAFNRSMGIPGSLDSLIDTDIFGTTTFRNYYDRYLYRMVAKSNLDSVSDYSAPDSLFFIESQPMIDSVYIDSIHPVVLFSVPGDQSFKDIKVEMVWNDSVLVADTVYRGEPRDIIKRPYLFETINVDSVRGAAQSIADRTFGIRVTAWLMVTQGSTGWGIAVAKLVVPE
jgi:hypothetical protein